MKLDLKTLGDEAQKLVKELLKETLSGSTDDLDTYIREIMSDLIAILAVPNATVREAAYKELLGQFRAVAEKNRLKAVNNAWDKVERIGQIAFNLLLTGIKAAL